jgi:hypothetical protein
MGMVGGAFGGGKVDSGCDDRELARAFSGPQTIASCKILITTKKAKKAGVTMEDCMGPQPEPLPVQAAPLMPEVIFVPVAYPPIVQPAPPVLPKNKTIHHRAHPCPIVKSETKMSCIMHCTMQ